MKINWGTSIIMAFALFISFILYFVIKVQSNSKYDNELVTEDYYKKELVYSKQLQKEQNAIDMSINVNISKSSKGIEIQFPTNLEFSKIKGTVFFYRPSNEKLDFKIPILLSTSQMQIPQNILVGGLWNISVEWSYDGKEFLSKKSIYF